MIMKLKTGAIEIIKMSANKQRRRKRTFKDTKIKMFTWLDNQDISLISDQDEHILLRKTSLRYTEVRRTDTQPSSSLT